MRTFAIGDIHGSSLELKRLYEKLLSEAQLDPEKDKLVFVGDYVDGGFDVKGVLTQLIEWDKKYPHWVFLLGNHEDMMLDALIGNQKRYKDFYLWWNQGGRATTNSYKRDLGEELTDYDRALMNPREIISSEHIEWLMHRPIYHEDEHYFFIHAGVPHAIKLEHFTKKIDEGDESYREIGLWIRDEFINSKHKWEKKIIFGHTPQQPALLMDNKIGIDTMTRMGGYLTAVELPAEKFYQTESLKEPFW